ncbi:MAG: CDP-alcohol phosphatidyltransferase family protein [Holosporales bacterium]|jgi:phosphatidylglycerophosphate synthase|nr:CDP-alcohol phosphatidyltransferase family protein [Holosporales bacterium]
MIPISAIPNTLTVLRIILAPLVCIGACNGLYAWSVCAFWFASVSDFFDGYLARRLRCQSFFGRVADPVADKLLTLCAYIPMRADFPYLFWLVILRDVSILVGVGVLHFCHIKCEIVPSTISKVNTGFTLLLPFIWLCLKCCHINGRALLEGLAAIVMVTTVCSAWGYARTFTKTLRSHRAPD